MRNMLKEYILNTVIYRRKVEFMIKKQTAMEARIIFTVINYHVRSDKFILFIIFDSIWTFHKHDIIKFKRDQRCYR